jgi:hypothetical protein
LSSARKTLIVSRTTSFSPVRLGRAICFTDELQDRDPGLAHYDERAVAIPARIQGARLSWRSLRRPRLREHAWRGGCATPGTLIQRSPGTERRESTSRPSPTASQQHQVEVRPGQQSRSPSRPALNRLPDNRPARRVSDHSCYWRGLSNPFHDRRLGSPMSASGSTKLRVCGAFRGGR